MVSFESDTIDQHLSTRYSAHMSKVATAFYKKASALEREVQELKTRAFFALPNIQQEAYPTKDIIRALKKTRSQIYRARYAKK